MLFILLNAASVVGDWAGRPMGRKPRPVIHMSHLILMSSSDFTICIQTLYHSNTPCGSSRL